MTTTTTPTLMTVLYERDLHRAEFTSLTITYNWTAYVVVHCLWRHTRDRNATQAHFCAEKPTFMSLADSLADSVRERWIMHEHWRWRKPWRSIWQHLATAVLDLTWRKDSQRSDRPCKKHSQSYRVDSTKTPVYICSFFPQDYHRLENHLEQKIVSSTTAENFKNIECFPLVRWCYTKDWVQSK